VAARGGVPRRGIGSDRTAAISPLLSEKERRRNCFFFFFFIFFVSVFFFFFLFFFFFVFSARFVVLVDFALKFPSFPRSSLRLRLCVCVSALS
jgi:hypothetical protein